MGDINELYREGLALPQMLDVVDDEVAILVNIPAPLSNMAKNSSDNIVKGMTVFFKNASTQQDINLITQKIKDHEETVAYAENLQLKLLYRILDKGSYIALAINSIESHYPVIVPPYEWKFLKIDKSKNLAYCEDRNYTAIKFVHRDSLKKQLAELTPLIGNSAEFALTTPAKLELSTEQAQESEITLDTTRGQTSSGKEKTLGTRTRTTNLRKAIRAAIKHLKKKPTLKDLIRCFEKDIKRREEKPIDDMKYIIEVTDTHVKWNTTKGNLKSTAITTVANMLSDENQP